MCSMKNWEGYISDVSLVRHKFWGYYTRLGRSSEYFLGILNWELSIVSSELHHLYILESKLNIYHPFFQKNEINH